MTASDVVFINPSLSLPLAELSFHFSRSSGPGGQHVNRTESRVELRFDVANSPSLDERQRARLMKKLGNQINSEGIFNLFVDTHRSQFQNRQAAIRRFQELLQSALKPEKKRTPTKPSRASKERRLQSKKQISEKKRLRRKPSTDE